MKSLKFPELEFLEYEGRNIIRHNENNENIEEEDEDEDEDEDKEGGNDLIDFESLKKLKSLRIDNISQFEHFKNSPLESVEICADYSFFKEEEKKC